MKLLTFQAKRFWWKSHRQTLADARTDHVEGELRDAVVVFLHAEQRDEGDEARRRVVRQTVKHVKWIANKGELRNVVLHSFTHLGGDNASPAFAESLIGELTDRLGSYHVESTPFGWFCEWDLQVFGDSLAKVWKEI